MGAGGGRLRDSRRSAGADLRRVPRAGRQRGGSDVDRVAVARGPLRREARDARRDDRRYGRRHRSDLGQAKSRIMRALTDLLDEWVPVVAGCEIHDDPLAPICGACRARVASEGDRMSIAWLSREDRYVEKLATPDVTIADMVGDIDP